MANNYKVTVHEPMQASNEISAKELQLLGSEKFDSVYFHGKTMLPFLREADELRVTPISMDKISRGDIVTYLMDDKFPTRRIIKIKKNQNIMHIQGDSIPHIKFMVPFDSVIGQVIARKRNGKWIDNSSASWRFTAFIILFREKTKLFITRFKKKGLAQAFKIFR